jgi:hypothetical protein
MARIPSFNTAAFFFLCEISPTGNKKKPSATSRKELKKELPEHSPYFLEKKRKKKEEFARLDSESV